MQSILKQIDNHNYTEDCSQPILREGVFRAVPVVVVPDSNTDTTSGASLYSIVRSRLDGCKSSSVFSGEISAEEDAEEEPACPCLSVGWNRLQNLVNEELESISQLHSRLLNYSEGDGDISQLLFQLLLCEQRRQHALQLISTEESESKTTVDTECLATTRPTSYQLKVSQILLPIDINLLLKHERHCFVCLLRSPIGCIYASKMADLGQADYSEASALTVPCAVSVPCLAADFNVALQVYWLRLVCDAPVAAGGCSYRVPNKRRRFFPRLGVKSLLSGEQQQQKLHKQQEKMQWKKRQFNLLGEVSITMDLVRLSAGNVSIEAPPIGSCPVRGNISVRCGVQTEPDGRLR
ncbi:hypothetical protein BOX15_Mlig031731g1 [Macrostomum lignano]|uniref:Uncharacterized protein n=2 Tax=Macrostomum lignano TaxID=282301 RepID=A0A267DKN4_9PLAT|nr:hypothetical protein BOX15_Mlig031731g1 [Macrostomum lignano]